MKKIALFSLLSMSLGPYLQADNGLAFVGSGHKGSFLGAFRMDGQGDIKGSDKVAWTIGHQR